MTHSKPPAKQSNSGDIDRFLADVKQTPSLYRTGRGRLLFAMDATASRQPTWDRACQLQGDMFSQTRGLGGLDVQLCFYRGYDEFRISPWHDNADRLLKAMLTVSCLGGHTQIRRVLNHAIAEHQRQAIHALVLVGDCIEEPIDDLCQLAGELGLLGVPVFLFQEGNDINALRGFKQIARLSHGAHCHFDINSPHQLGELLNAVAVYASGGSPALEKMASQSEAVKRLSHQLGKSSL
ncbi:MAG: VWA domain-containing protein [Motiliproteus sp.]|nr:VWA domain-containing protein [Motiliproteus sp.]MCW9054256.1 VWA domain-containing protein [Motiliproteus sp.]